MDLLQLCGIDNLPKRRRERWVKARLKFIGAESYVLGTKYLEVSLGTNSGGISVQFKEEGLGFRAESLLGRVINTGTLFDVVLSFESDMPDLSLAHMSPGAYPRVLRRGEVLRIDE